MTDEELQELDNDELQELLERITDLLSDRASDAHSSQFDWDRTAKND